MPTTPTAVQTTALLTDNDGAGVVDPGDVVQTTVTIAAVNNAPVADDDSYNVDEDNVLSVAAAGVLDGDTDADGDARSRLFWFLGLRMVH
jgi:Bacterial cadherin-like domain